MSLVPSLLQAIVTTDGEALVLHVGEKPYVVTPTGQVDLATRGLTFAAVDGIVNEILPVESQRALDEFGAVQYELPAIVEFPGEQFTIVAARGGDDLWAEIRRKTVPDEDRVPAELFGPTVATAHEEEPPVRHEDNLDVPGTSQLWPGTERPAEVEAPPPRMPAAPSPPVTPPAPARAEVRPPVPVPPAPPVVKPSLPLIPPPPRDATPDVVASVTARLQAAPPLQPAAPTPPAPVQAPPTVLPPPPPTLVAAPPAAEVPAPVVPPIPRPAAVPPARLVAPIQPPVPAVPETKVAAVSPPPPPLQRAPLVAPPLPVYAPPPVTATILDAPAPVVPIARNPIKPDVPAPLVVDALGGLDRLLRLAAARGASTLYLSSSARPTLRVDGDIQLIEGAPVLSSNDVEALILTLMPARNAEALRSGVASEWICDVPEVGRVRCMTFSDHRGPGGVFRMMPLRMVTAEQLNLSRQIQGLAIEPEGLVLVAGPRQSGKRTLMSALVDLINRMRRDHVITVETEINMLHERVGSFVSQREVRGGREEMLTVARAALREDPDVLVLEDLRTAGLMSLALDAAASGQLVIGGLPAHNASGAIDRIIDLYPPENRRQIQLSLAQNLRGVVAQVLLRKLTGGRVAARELLLNTAAVRGVLAEGRTSQLPQAIEGGRPYGMVPLNDALVGFVQSGAVDAREAYERSVDRAGFLALLKRQGLDTSLIERPA